MNIWANCIEMWVYWFSMRRHWMILCQWIITALLTSIQFHQPTSHEHWQVGFLTFSLWQNSFLIGTTKTLTNKLSSTATEFKNLFSCLCIYEARVHVKSQHTHTHNVPGTSTLHGTKSATQNFFLWLCCTPLRIKPYPTQEWNWVDETSFFYD